MTLEELSMFLGWSLIIICVMYLVSYLVVRVCWPQLWKQKDTIEEKKDFKYNIDKLSITDWNKPPFFRSPKENDCREFKIIRNKKSKNISKIKSSKQVKKL